jgi:hypothetical protein
VLHEVAHGALAVVLVDGHPPVVEIQRLARTATEQLAHVRRREHHTQALLDDVGDGRDLLHQRAEPGLGLLQLPGQALTRDHGGEQPGQLLRASHLDLLERLLVEVVELHHVRQEIVLVDADGDVEGGADALEEGRHTGRLGVAGPVHRHRRPGAFHPVVAELVGYQPRPRQHLGVVQAAVGGHDRDHLRIVPHLAEGGVVGIEHRDRVLQQTGDQRLGVSHAPDPAWPGGTRRPARPG